MGQDPYPSIEHDGKATATGLAFSTRPGYPVPGSLKNIFNVLSKTVPGWQVPNHGSLESWAKQGVLLLNKCLTVRPGMPKSHKEIWSGFLTHVARALMSRTKLVYLLWGRDAQEMKWLVGERGIFLETTHPSPKSARMGFLDRDHFNECNRHLMANGQAPIDWRL